MAREKTIVAQRQQAITVAEEAKLVLQYAEIWEREVERETLQELLTEEPFAVQAKFKACKKFASYIRSQIKTGAMAERKLREVKENEI